MEQKTIYQAYEEIKALEINELKEKLSRCKGHAYTFDEYGPYICLNTEGGPMDVRVLSAALTPDGFLRICAYEAFSGEEIDVDIDDIAYGHIEFITAEINIKTAA